MEFLLRSLRQDGEDGEQGERGGQGARGSLRQDGEQGERGGQDCPEGSVPGRWRPASESGSGKVASVGLVYGGRFWYLIEGPTDLNPGFNKWRSDLMPRAGM